MAPPNLTVEQVRQIFPDAANVEMKDSCGQKIVFGGIINGRRYALKFMKPDPSSTNGMDDEFLDDVTARAQREVETMQQCSTPHLVKMGPVGLRSTIIGSERIIYFTEEWVEGKNLCQYLNDNGNLSIEELINLGFHISDAIEAIWNFHKIHRDIKPGNIMRCSSNGEFILLDMGLVFDLQDVSLSVCPVGTPIYFSPEQMDFDSRRTVMNFRSDLFSLGIVMYEMATGRHPFITPSVRTSWEVLTNIKNMDPVFPKTIRNDLPEKLNDVIMRLLAKRPALRYRSIQLFRAALQEIVVEGGIQ